MQVSRPGAEKQTLVTCAADMPWFSEEAQRFKGFYVAI